MKSRKDLEEEIMKKMKDMRDNLGQSDNQAAEEDPNTVPYDKDAARSVIEQFIRDHPDKERFMADLKKKMDD